MHLSFTHPFIYSFIHLFMQLLHAVIHFIYFIIPSHFVLSIIPLILVRFGCIRLHPVVDACVCTRVSFRNLCYYIFNFLFTSTKRQVLRKSASSLLGKHQSLWSEYPCYVLCSTIKYTRKSCSVAPLGGLCRNVNLEVSSTHGD